MALLTSGIVELEGLGLLGGVRVIGARVDLELLVNLAAERTLGEHTPDRTQDEVGRVALDQLLGGLRAQAAREQRVVAVELARPLLARQLDLLGVHDDDEVTRVGVSRERRAVLPAQDVRDLSGGAAERQAFDVGDEPGARERLLGLVGRTMMRGSGSHETKRGFYLRPAALSTCGGDVIDEGPGAPIRARKSPIAAQARRVRSSFSMRAKRTNPSPPGPKPTPGETATRARSSSSEAKRTEPRGAPWGGSGAQTNIDAMGTGTGHPTRASSVQSS